MSADAPAVLGPRVRFGVLVAVVLVGSGAFVVLGAPSPGEVRDAVADLGPLAPVAWVVLYALLTVAFFPGAISTAASGLLFGPWLGTALALVGALLGSTAAFLVGRSLGRDQVLAFAGRRLQRLDDHLADRGLLAVLYLRLVPLVPFNAFNYLAGVTALDLRDYVIGTAIGIVPGTFAYAALGGSLDDLGSPLGILAISLVVVLAVAGPMLSRRLSTSGPDPVDPADESGA